MNILIIGAFGNGAIENFYVKGLQNSNVDVTCYDIATEYYAVITNSIYDKIVNKIAPNYLLKSINNKLLIFLNGKNYDAIIVFKGMQLYPETIQYVNNHTKILANYNPDHPFLFYSAGSGNNNVLNSIKYFDIYFSYSSQITRQLAEKYNVLAYTIPFAYDDSKEIVKVTMTDIKRKFLFIGSYDRRRAKFLKGIANPLLYIYGDVKWETRNRYSNILQTAYQNKSLYGIDYKYAVADAVGVINLMRKQNLREQSHNMRTFEVPGYRGLLITERTDEQLTFFEEDKEAIYFDTPEELNTKMTFLFKNPATVDRLKEAAYQRCIKSGYSYRERSLQLLQIIKMHL